MSLPVDPKSVFFYVFSAIGLVFALRVVLGKSPISSAFSLVVVFFSMAASFVLLEAHFIAAMQVLVYAGAIMVLFVFVIMLLNADSKAVSVAKKRVPLLGSVSLCVALLGLFAYAIVKGAPSPHRMGLTPQKVDALGGNVQVISQFMFSDYVLPFELTSILLVVGIVGSVALAKRRLE